LTVEMIRNLTKKIKFITWSFNKWLSIG
jgi:hypothetical protein